MGESRSNAGLGIGRDQRSRAASTDFSQYQVRHSMAATDTLVYNKFRHWLPVMTDINKGIKQAIFKGWIFGIKAAYLGNDFLIEL